MSRFVVRVARGDLTQVRCIMNSLEFFEGILLSYPHASVVDYTYVDTLA